MPPHPVGTLLAVLAALLVLSGPALAQDVHFEAVTVHMEPTRFDAQLEGQRIEGTQAAALRQLIDERHGDEDGIVIPAEVDAYRTAEIAEFNEGLSSPFARVLTREIRVNDRSPIQQLVTDVALSPNVVGAVDDESTILRSINASIVFGSTESDRVNVTFKQNFAQAFITATGRMEWETAHFLGREPWAVDGTTIEPGGVDNPYWTGEGFEVAYEEMGNFSSFNAPLAFELADLRTADDGGSSSKKSPGPAFLLVLAALTLAATGRRRR